MENVVANQSSTLLSKAELLNHWQGHRNLTRRAIVLFPEKEFFEFSIGGMRTFSKMVDELLAIATPGLKEMVGTASEFSEELGHGNDKAKVLQLWDESTELINTYWAQIPEEKFQQEFQLFGQYNGTGISHIFYFVDNEIHHRAQGFVYLRALGIQPPFFWER